jgi:Peptidase family M48
MVVFWSLAIWAVVAIFRGSGWAWRRPALGIAAPLILGRPDRLDQRPPGGRLPVAGGHRRRTVGGGVGRAAVACGVQPVAERPGGAAGDLLDGGARRPGRSHRHPRALLGLALLALVVGGLLVGGLVAGTRGWRAARGQRELLALAGSSQPGLPGLPGLPRVTVLYHPAALAYCLPRRVEHRPGPIVVTTATLEQFDPAQLAAVVAHEHAHQRRHHHHALLLAAQVLRIGFPWLPAARAARSAVVRLVELAADDVAVALATLAAVPAPTLGLGAGGPTTVERVRRLTNSSTRGPGSTLLLASLVVAVPWRASCSP